MYHDYEFIVVWLPIFNNEHFFCLVQISSVCIQSFVHLTLVYIYMKIFCSDINVFFLYTYSVICTKAGTALLSVRLWLSDKLVTYMLTCTC